MKDPDSESLDAGWEDLDPVAPPAPGVASGPPDGLDDLDEGWDDAPSDESDDSRASGQPATRSGKLGKRERRALERKKRLLAEQRKAERKAAGKRERQEAARRAAAEHEEERRRAQALRERSLRDQPAKRTRNDSPSRATKASRSRNTRVEEPESAEAPPRRRFVMPNGGWYIVVIALITLGTAWYAFGR